MFQDLIDFYEKHDLERRYVPGFRTPVQMVYRSGFMQEELNEFNAAVAAGDLPSAADALADLVYVALGTAVEMGLPFEAVWDEVHAANMAKRRQMATDPVHPERGPQEMIVKPEGWRPPDVAKVLQDFGYRPDHGGRCVA